ncbi:glycoside hydrolase superfamily [Rhypophila decipiens]
MMLVSTLVCLGTLLQLGAAKVQFLGMAISGGDFGCQIDGSCPTGSSQLPLGSFGMGGGDGEGQMKHFTQTNGMNMFRLPISWQFLVNNNLGGDLDAGNFAKFDKLVQTCLATGAYCMIDIHNFARWDGGIIGQGGPTDEQFVSLWRQLASKYANSEKMVFELMNEPHHLDVKIWAATCQKVIKAIREAGAVKQMILLPGSNFDSAATLATPEGGAEELMALTNPDGTTDNLLLDVHKYLDNDNSGTHEECVTDNIEAFQQVAEFLRKTGRKGLVSETGAPPNAPECMARFCAQNAFINRNSDVFVGLVGWAAGSFDTSYLLSMTPRKVNGRFENNALATECFIGTWKETPEDIKPGSGNVISNRTTTSTTTSPSNASTSSTGSVTNTPTGSSTVTSTADSTITTGTERVTSSGTSSGTASEASPTTTVSGDWTLIITRRQVLAILGAALVATVLSAVVV